MERDRQDAAQKRRAVVRIADPMREVKKARGSAKAASFGGSKPVPVAKPATPRHNKASASAKAAASGGSKPPQGGLAADFADLVASGALTADVAAEVKCLQPQHADAMREKSATESKNRRLSKKVAAMEAKKTDLWRQLAEERREANKAIADAQAVQSEANVARADGSLAYQRAEELEARFNALRSRVYKAESSTRSEVERTRAQFVDAYRELSARTADFEMAHAEDVEDLVGLDGALPEAAEVDPVPPSDAGEGPSATPAPAAASEDPAPAPAPTGEDTLKVVAEPAAEDPTATAGPSQLALNKCEVLTLVFEVLGLVDITWMTLWAADGWCAYDMVEHVGGQGFASGCCFGQRVGFFVSSAVHMLQGETLELLLKTANGRKILHKCRVFC
eukprot:XP_020406460.1 actin cytoskeleton-regulatory complex protein PAN1-like [Zea mays]